MSEAKVALVLWADGIFNLIAGVVLQFYILPIMAIIGWPETDVPIYSTVLGSALIGLSLAVIFAARHPHQYRTTIFAGIIAKTGAGVSILNAILILHIPLPQPVPLIAAVVIQVLFVLAEGLYLLSSGKAAAMPNRAQVSN